MADSNQDSERLRVESDPTPILESMRSASFRALYSNFFKYRMSPNDVALTFCNLTDVAEPPARLVSVDEVQVVMSYSQAKVVSEYLALIVSNYEREFGSIRSFGPAPADAELQPMMSFLRSLGSH